MKTDFCLPFPALPPADPSQYAHAEQACVDWLLEFELLPDAAIPAFRKVRLAEPSTRICTGSDSPEPVMYALTLTWSAMVDDHFDGPAGECPRRARSDVDDLIAVFNGEAPTGSLPRNLAAATADYWSRLATDASTWWRRKAAADWQRFVGAHFDEADMRHRGIPSLPTYLRVRRASVAIPALSRAAEKSWGFELPEHLSCTDTVEAMLECVSDICGFTNDVYSFEHERSRGDTCNLVLVLAHERNYSDQRAVEEIYEIVQEASSRFEALAAQLTQHCRSDSDILATERYITMLRNEVRVADDWSKTTSRYAD
ncbi:terpene synthase family protein [Mycobacteroides abscessus]